MGKWSQYFFLATQCNKCYQKLMSETCKHGTEKPWVCIDCVRETMPAESLPSKSDGTTYVDLVKSQAYIIQHQQDLLNNCIRRNASLVNAINQTERENQKLRRNIKAHQDGKLWTIISAMLPTRDMLDKVRDEP